MNTVFEILRKFEENNYECFIIGGFVRDYLLGIASNDLDLTTNAPLKFIEDNFEIINDMGKPYGNLQCKYKNIKFEITKYRVDLSYNEKRQPEVKFVKDLDVDIMRRDFTINTICLDSHHQFIDILGAKKDLDNKIVRAIGNPMEKFREDPLRIYRMFRFAMKYKFTIDIDTLEAANCNVLRLNTLNKNVVYKEVKAIIESVNEENINLYNILNTWITWLPSIDETDYGNLDVKVKEAKKTIFGGSNANI